MTPAPAVRFVHSFPGEGCQVYRELIGGGSTQPFATELYRPFVDAAGTRPHIACVVLRETEQPEDADTHFARWVEILPRAAPCQPFPVIVEEGSTLDPAVLDGADGLFVCGGLTPAYAAAMVPAASAIRGWLDRGHPYLGFSAGSAIAADRAIVGGWLGDGRPICPEDSAEDLDDIAVVPGLGLVPFAVDVHCAPWGTLPRAIWAVTHGLVSAAVCLDESTGIVATDNAIEVIGVGYAYLVRPRACSVDDSGATSVSVTPLVAGERFDREPATT
jgi:cyanophycinase